MKPSNSNRFRQCCDTMTREPHAIDCADCPPEPQPSPSPSVPETQEAEREAAEWARPYCGAVGIKEAHLAGQAVGEKRERDWWAEKYARLFLDADTAEARIAELSGRVKELEAMLEDRKGR